METQISADVKHSGILIYLKKSIGCKLTVSVNCCDYTVVVMGKYVRMEHWWNQGIQCAGGKPFPLPLQHKSHMDNHGNETGILEVTCHMWKDGQ
jgi:hypothetical protein